MLGHTGWWQVAVNRNDDDINGYARANLSATSHYRLVKALFFYSPPYRQYPTRRAHRRPYEHFRHTCIVFAR